MPCFYPLPAIQTPGGEILIYSRLNPPLTVAAHIGRHIKLPCGRCIGCKIQRSQEWATRCLHESQQYENNCFLTCTISEEHLARAAPGGSLSRSIHQTFLKRVRARYEHQIRFYMCGEYGEKLKRPHYHYLLFNHTFSDRQYSHTSESGEKLYRSEVLEDLWQFGKCWIGDVTYESCAYVASYVMKKLSGELAVDHYRRIDEAGNEYWLEPEFNLMSRRPGIGKHWWEQFNQDVINEDVVVRKNGGKMRPPRYYDKLLELFDSKLMVELKYKRELRAKLLNEDNTPARLEVKELVTKAKLKIKNRNLEKLK